MEREHQLSYVLFLRQIMGRPKQAPNQILSKIKIKIHKQIKISKHLLPAKTNILLRTKSTINASREKTRSNTQAWPEIIANNFKKNNVISHKLSNCVSNIFPQKQKLIESKYELLTKIHSLASDENYEIWNTLLSRLLGILCDLPICRHRLLHDPIDVGDWEPVLIADVAMLPRKGRRVWPKKGKRMCLGRGLWLSQWLRARNWCCFIEVKEGDVKVDEREGSRVQRNWKKEKGDIFRDLHGRGITPGVKCEEERKRKYLQLFG